MREILKKAYLYADIEDKFARALVNFLVYGVVVGLTTLIAYLFTR